MRTAVFMRHAHAEPEAAQGDHARPLNARGRDASRQAALDLRTHGVVPEAVLCSTARRARETAELVLAAFVGGVALAEQNELYLAEPQAYLDAVRKLPDGVRTALLVAHNPGLEQLAARFGDDRTLRPADHFIVARDVASWREFAP